MSMIAMITIAIYPSPSLDLMMHHRRIINSKTMMLL